MPANRRSARDLSAEFAQAARRQRPEEEAPPSPDEEPSRGLAGVIASDATSDLATGQPYARLYVSWDTADTLDREHRALRRMHRGRISKLQLLDALIDVALKHPEEVVSRLGQRTSENRDQ
jgi:hypothetical protein